MTTEPAAEYQSLAPVWEAKLEQAAKGNLRDGKLLEMDDDIGDWGACAVGEILGIKDRLKGTTVIPAQIDPPRTDDGIWELGFDLCEQVRDGNYKDALDNLREFSRTHTKHDAICEAATGLGIHIQKHEDDNAGCECMSNSKPLVESLMADC